MAERNAKLIEDAKDSGSTAVVNTGLRSAFMDHNQGAACACDHLWDLVSKRLREYFDQHGFQYKSEVFREQYGRHPGSGECLPLSAGSWKATIIKVHHAQPALILYAVAVQ